jgi:hypothetical protein
VQDSENEDDECNQEDEDEGEDEESEDENSSASDTDASLLVGFIPSAPEEFPKMQLVPFRNLLWQHFHAALFHLIASMLILIVLSIFGI